MRFDYFPKNLDLKFKETLNVVVVIIIIIIFEQQLFVVLSIHNHFQFPQSFLINRTFQTNDNSF